MFDRQPIASRGRQLVEAPTPPPRSTSGRSLESKPDPVPREIGREPRRPEPEPVDELDEARRELADLTERWKTEPPREVRDVQRIIDVAREASEKAEHANPFTRGWLRHAAERTAAEQSQLLKQTAPWLENTTIPATYAEANAFRTTHPRPRSTTCVNPTRIACADSTAAASTNESNKDWLRTSKKQRQHTNRFRSHITGTAARNAEGRRPKTPALRLKVL